MKISSEKFKRDFVEKKASHGIDEADKNQYLKQFYGSEPAYNRKPGKVTQEVLDQVNKIADHISKLGLTKFADLKAKFTASEYSERPMAQIMAIKESMEAILFAIETGDRKKEDIVNQFKDRYFACSDGTLTNLQGILAEMVMSDNKVESYFTLQKKAFMEQVAIDMLRENKFPEFKESRRGMEIHDVSSLLNSISTEYGIVKKTKEEDIHLKDMISYRSRHLLTTEIEKKLQDPNVVDTFIDGVTQRIQDNLPYYEASKEEFFTELYSALESLGLTGVIDPTALVKYEDGILGYKDNVHSVLRDAVTLHLHNTGIVQVPDIEKVKTRIAIENSTDASVSFNRVSKDVLDDAKSNGMLEYAVKYILGHGIKLDEEDFPDNNIIKYMISELGVQQTLKIALESISFGIEDINYCLEQGGKIEADSGIDLNLALMVNVEKGSKEMVNLLLEKGADPKVRYTQGDSALVLAARRGHTEVAGILLEKGADVNWAHQNENTALELAAGGGNTEMVKMLLEKGATVNRKDMLGHTVNPALTVAVERSNAEIVGMLLEKTTTVDKSTLMLAVEKGSAEIVGMLLEKSTVVDQEALILLAVEKGDAEIVDTLLKNALVVEPKMLMNYIRIAIENRNDEVLKILIDRVDDKSEALKYALNKGNIYAVKLLLEKGADVNKVDGYGNSPLHTAIDSGNAEAVRLLVEKGADVNKVSYSWGTPLSCAVGLVSTEIFKYLLLNGASTEITDYRGSKAENFLEMALDDYKGTAEFRDAIKAYKNLQNSVSAVLTDGLREGLQSGKYQTIDSFISAFTTKLGDMASQPQFKQKFVDRIKDFAEAKAEIRLNFYEEFKATVIGIFTKGTVAQEMEIAKLKKHLDRAYNIVQNHEECKELAVGIKDMLKIERPEVQATRGGVSR